MEACVAADAHAGRGDFRSMIALLVIAVGHEHLAIGRAPIAGITRAVLYRSASAIARQLSVALAVQGLTCNPDERLSKELEELANG